MSFTDNTFYELSGPALAKADMYFAEFDARRKLRREFAAKHGCADVLVGVSGDCAGLANPLDGQAPTTLGWKMDKRNTAYFYPDRRKRKRRNELVREMSSLRDPTVPFGQQWHFAGCALYVPHLLRMGGIAFYMHHRDAKVPAEVASCTLWRNSDVLRLIEDTKGKNIAVESDV